MTQKEKSLIQAGRDASVNETDARVRFLLSELSDLAEKAIEERDASTHNELAVPQTPLTKGQMNALCSRVPKKYLPKFFYSALFYEKDLPIEASPEDGKICARDWVDASSDIANDYGKDWVVFLAEPTQAELDAIEWDKEE